MAEFDFDAARRWARFDPGNTLARRGDDELPFVSAGLIAGQGLLLDTCVYIDQMQDRSPQVLDDLIARRQVNHSTVAIQELMHTVGVLIPTNARTASVVDVIGKQVKAMPPYRILAPDIEVQGRGTPTILLTATSRQRVYQFRHERLGYRLEATASAGSTAPM